jgi:hypothetical protein
MVSLSYMRGGEMITMKDRYSSPFIENERRDRQIPRHSLANFPIPLTGYKFVHDGIPVEVIDYDGADIVTVVFNPVMKVDWFFSARVMATYQAKLVQSSFPIHPQT